MERERRAAVRWMRTLGLAARWVWCSRPGVLMFGYLVLALARRLAGEPGLPPTSAAGGVSLVLVAFWCWRVASGGRISRRILYLVTFAAYEPAAFHLAVWWNRPAAWLLALGAAEFAILLSPAVYLRTRPDFVPGSVTVTVPPEAYLRLWPRRWMLGLAALGGLAVTALLLIALHWPPGTGPAVHGEPLGVLTAARAPVAHWGAALARDWTQWTEVSLAVVYLIALAARSRPDILPVPAWTRRPGPGGPEPAAVQPAGP